MAAVKIDLPAHIPRSNQTLSDNVNRIILSAFGWLALYFITGWISKILIPQVRTLRPKDQMFWGLSMVRAISGLLTIWAGYLVYVDPLLSMDHVFATTPDSWTFTCIVIGFFIFEELTLIYFDIRYGTFSKELHFHHIVSFNGWFIAGWSGVGHYYAVHMFLLEGSTPFSCVCWCLLKLKLENTKVWKINQWILINIFHARTFYELSCWYIYYHDWNSMKTNLPWIFIVNMFGGLAMLTVWLTPYWTYKKTAQFFVPTDWNAEVEKRKKDNKKES